MLQLNSQQNPYGLKKSVMDARELAHFGLGSGIGFITLLNIVIFKHCDRYTATQQTKQLAWARFSH